MKKRRLSILLSIVMLFSLLPTTALATDIPDPTFVSVDGGKGFASPSQLYYKNNDPKGIFSGTDTDFNAAYEPSSGTLTLNGYKGGKIALGGAAADHLTIKLIGDNKITVNGDEGIGANTNGSSITITADNGSSGKLTIDVTSDSAAAAGINNNYVPSATSGNVTIKGYADVTIKATTNGKDKECYGIYANKVVIEDDAKVAITVKAPNNEGGSIYGIFVKDNATINTAGEITVDASDAGTTDRVSSTGINSRNTLTLTKVGKMTVKWKDKSLGAPLYPSSASFDSDAYDNHVDMTNCIATYTPKVATANISLSETGTVNFGSMEKGYSAAPTEQSVTITNNGTAATGSLTIALDGDNKTDFTLNKTSITNIAASGTDTFTVQPNTGLSAGTYTATVKVSGTGAGVTEQKFDVKFTVTAPLTAIAVPTANSVTYDGAKQTGVSAGTGYTLGGVYEATDVGTTADYAATATLNTGYKWTDGSTDVKTINWNIGKKTPTVADFIFTAPTDLIYSGTDKTASVTLKSSLTKSGAITPTYMKGSSVVTETKDVGTYTVKIDVAGGDNFSVGSGLTDSAWTFSITPAEWGTPTETLTPVNPTTVGGNDGQITGTTNAMQYKKSDGTWTDCIGDVTGLAAGTYYVRYKADGNHTASDTKYQTVTLIDPGTALYSVTVTGGAAAPTGNQAAGAEVTITANTKTGFHFKEWTGLDAGVYKTGSTKTSNPATFIMPASNVDVTATYEAAALTGTASITGTLKYGQTLTADTSGITNNTGTLTYKWYRSGKTAEIATNNTGTYTLTADDIGKTITVKITSSVQSGEITSPATGTIGKADGPVAPSVTPVACTNSSNNDGKITGVNTTMEYSNASDFSTKTICTGSVITGLANGTYYVRVAETTTHKAGAAATVIVSAYTASGTSGGTSSGGSGGGGYIPSTTPTAKPSTEPVQAGKATTSDLAADTTSKGNETSTTVSQAAADKIVDAAVKNRSEEIVISTKVKNEAAASGVKAAKLILPTTALQTIAEKTDAKLTLQTDVGQITLDNKTIAAVAAQSGSGTVSMSISKVKDAAKEVRFELQITGADGKQVSDFSGGKATIVVAVPQALSGKKIGCVYIDANAHYHKVPGKLNTDGSYTFTTEHFSSYAIMEAAAIEESIVAQKAAVKELKVKLTSKLVKSKKGKKQISLRWKNTSTMQLDGVQIYRSTKRNSGYSKKVMLTSKNSKYTDTAVKQGKKYYYKARGYVTIDGKRVYTAASTKAYRTVK